MAKKRRGRSAAFMRSINPFLKKRRSSKLNKSRLKRSMAKRTKRTYSRFGGAVKPISILIGAGIYGAARAKVSNFLAPITAKIPLGNVSDEAGLFLAAWILNKKLKGKLVQDITMSAMAVEAARMGEAAIDGSIFSSASNGAGVSTSSYSTLG